MTTDEKRTPENDADEGVPSLPDLLANLEHTRASQAEVSDRIDRLEDELVTLQEREFRIGTEVSKLLGLPREERTEVDGEWRTVGAPGRYDAFLLASEPLTRDVTGWVEVPEYSALMVHGKGAERRVSMADIDV